MTDAIPVRSIAGLKPWACTYDGQDGARYGITLYGSDPNQVLEDNCESLPGLTVDGELDSIIPVDPKDAEEIARRFGRKP